MGIKLASSRYRRMTCNRHFIKAGVFDKSLSLLAGQGIRSTAAYGLPRTGGAAQEQATHILDQADHFVKTVAAHLAAAGKI